LKNISLQTLAVVTQQFLEDNSEILKISPNPFTNSFDYEYSVEAAGMVTVELYAMNGRKIKTVKNREGHIKGDYSAALDTGALDLGPLCLPHQRQT